MYRLWQFMRALTGRVRREEWALVLTADASEEDRLLAALQAADGQV